METRSEISESMIKNLTSILNLKSLSVIEKQYVHKQNQDYVLVSDVEEITDEVVGDLKQKSTEKFFYATAFPKLDCSFCFDHELDHLPFMMTIEVVRQVGVAIGHKFHGFPFHGFSNIMDKMQLHIDKFIELDIPLLVTLKDIVLKNKGSMQERMVYFDLYQNEIHCARIEINAIIMKKDIYMRLRKNNRLELIKNTALRESPVTNIELTQNEIFA